MPLEDAALIASWCHAGHCSEATGELPRLIAERRAAVAERIAGLRALDARLADLERHVGAPLRRLDVIASGPCCEAADAVFDVAEGRCACCAGSTTDR